MNAGLNHSRLLQVAGILLTATGVALVLAVVLASAVVVGAAVLVAAMLLFAAGAGLLFKGSGFYITDYGRGGSKPAAEKPATCGGGAKKDCACASSKAKKGSPA